DRDGVERDVGRVRDRRIINITVQRRRLVFVELQRRRLARHAGPLVMPAARVDTVAGEKVHRVGALSEDAVAELGGASFTHRGEHRRNDIKTVSASRHDARKRHMLPGTVRKHGDRMRIDQLLIAVNKKQDEGQFAEVVRPTGDSWETRLTGRYG